MKTLHSEFFSAIVAASSVFGNNPQNTCIFLLSVYRILIESPNPFLPFAKKKTFYPLMV